MKGQKFLKVTSILIIIGGVIGVIVGILGLISIAALAALSGEGQGMGLYYAAMGLAILASIIQFIAGIKGVGACSDPKKAGSCVKWGIVIVCITVVSIAITLIGGGELSITSIALNLLLPGLYTYGALQMKNANNG